MASAHEPSARRDSGRAGVSYRLTRELGRRSQATHAALREERPDLASGGSFAGPGLPPPALVVVQRFTRGQEALRDAASSQAMALLVRDARCLARNWHPNLARVRHVELVDDVVHVATDFIDGVTLEDLLVLVKSARRPLDEAILTRVFLDVLSGLTALHGLRDGANAPLDAIHGEICPANVVLGRDGVARLVALFRPRPVHVGATSEALRYASPEILTWSDQDLRADVWSAGVMLWEALTGRPLYADTDPARIVQRQREEEIAPPAGPLADVVMKAIAFDPLLRFRSAADMAAALRAREVSVAPGSAVAQIVLELAGERIRLRRSELHPGVSGERRAVDPRAWQSGAHAREPLQPSSVRGAASPSSEGERTVAPSSQELPRVASELLRVASVAAPLPSSEERPRTTPPAPGSARPEAAPRSDRSRDARDHAALMSFEKHPPVLEGAPPSSRRSRLAERAARSDSREMGGVGQGPLTMKPLPGAAPPGRVRRLSSRELRVPASPPISEPPSRDEAPVSPRARRAPGELEGRRPSNESAPPTLAHLQPSPSAPAEPPRDAGRYASVAGPAAPSSPESSNQLHAPSSAPEAGAGRYAAFDAGRYAAIAGAPQHTLALERAPVPAPSRPPVTQVMPPRMTPPPFAAAAPPPRMTPAPFAAAPPPRMTPPPFAATGSMAPLATPGAAAPFPHANDASPPAARDEITVRRPALSSRAPGGRVTAIIASGIALLALATLLAGGAFIARRRSPATPHAAPPPAPTTTLEAPSTVIVAPSASSPAPSLSSHDVGPGDEPRAEP